VTDVPKPLRLVVVGQTDPDPEQWQYGPDLTILVLARSEDEAAQLAGVKSQEMRARVFPVKCDKPTVLVEHIDWHY
jgi:hypothetical protein